MDEYYRMVRDKVKSIASVDFFNTLIDKCILTDDEKSILKLHYLKGKDFRYIGDILGFAESTIKHKHKSSVLKIGKLF